MRGLVLAVVWMGVVAGCSTEEEDRPAVLGESETAMAQSRYAPSPLCGGRPLQICATFALGPPLPTGLCKEQVDCYMCSLAIFDLGLGAEEFTTQKRQMEQDSEIWYNCTGVNDATCPLVKVQDTLRYWVTYDRRRTSECGDPDDCKAGESWIACP